jgi:hypothetical protein
MRVHSFYLPPHRALPRQTGLTRINAFDCQPPEHGVHLLGRESATMLSSDDLSGLRMQLVMYAGAALLVLLVATALSTYKPRGRTRYGARKLEQRTKPLHHVEFKGADL